ncbi:MAG: photosystem II S4 domain protein [Cyanobacteria bacterium J06638_7]
MLPRRALLEGSRHPAVLAAVLATAETALRTWQPCWTGFLEPGAREEAVERLGSLAELELRGEGGFPGAERQRLLVLRRLSGIDPLTVPADLGALEISGNFLFDPAEPADLRQALLSLGAPPQDMGDLWMRGDRGGQGVLHSAAVAALDGRQGQVRSVEVTLKALAIAALRPPVRAQPRRWQSVEASCRLDALASAGFGVSRARMANLIRAGQVRVNWQGSTSPSRELAAGDRVQLAGRGELAVVAISPTKRERWRIELERR